MRRLNRPNPTWPTLVGEILDARAGLTACDEVTLALRTHRSVVGQSQRGYAVERGWSKSHGGRLESDLGGMRLRDVIAALRGTGFELRVQPEKAEPDHATWPEPATPSWPSAELVARDAAGRRFPAAVTAFRQTSARSWYYTRVGQLADGPPWGWRRRV